MVCLLFNHDTNKKGDSFGVYFLGLRSVYWCFYLAESTGFEPVRDFLDPRGLANRCLKPLGQLSLISYVF
jgi:hypothetical protein